MKNPVLYDQSNIKQLPWPQTADGDYASRYLAPLVACGANSFIDNIITEVRVLTIDDLVLPITINDGQYENSYVCSPYTHYVTYAEAELSVLKNAKLEAILKVVLRFLGVILKCCRINRVVHVNNWLLSTNLYPELSPEQIKCITGFLRDIFPRHAIVFRSINIFDKKICAALLKSDYRMVTARQVYIFPQGALETLKSRPKSILKKDFHLLEASGYQWFDADSITENDLPRIIKLYNQLYLDKYSILNPQFNLEFLKLAWSEGVLKLFVLKKEDRIDGVIGFFSRNGTMTTPLFGYDLTLPQKNGIYRMLSAKLILEAERRGLVLNQSSGAAEFKRCRGGVPYLEYNAVYIKHLPFRSKLGWKLVEFLANQVGGSLVKKLKL
jgi:hypothetical protein